MKLLDRGEKLQRVDFQELLQKFFPGLPSAALSFLEDIHELRLFQPADVLLKEGESADGVLFMLCGTAVASFALKSKSNTTFREIMAPAIFGLSETMLGDANRATIVCESPIKAVFVPASSLIVAMRRFPLATLEFSKLIGDELSATYSKLAIMRHSLGGTHDGTNCR